MPKNSDTSEKPEGIDKPARPAEVYDAVMREGEEELGRSFSALWWSGIAAGLSIGFSVVATAAIGTALGFEASSKPIISLGYAAGFLIVILARQQLFTENTITALLPVITSRSWAGVRHMLRLWSIVLLANLIGGALFALATVSSVFLSPDIAEGVTHVSEHMMAFSVSQMFFKGIAAGWLIAALVWVLPTVRAGKFWPILFFTWLIALGEFTHVVAGSVEAFHLVFLGHIGLAEMVFGFFLPTLAGNIVGGSAIFALVSYAQVRSEVE
ncbi:MAG: formate/nitrite transporter family protein [Alphaproteobacteria bacterium]|nr:formate/nitrite transporter family protein [Alphaproteobacteria bacterium]